MNKDSTYVRDGYPFCLWTFELPYWYEDLTRQVVFKDFDPYVEGRYEELLEVTQWVSKNLSNSECRTIGSLRHTIYMCTEEVAFKFQLIFGEKIQKIWKIEDEDFYKECHS